MAEFKQPKTYLVGSSQLEVDGLTQYLNETGQGAFLDSILEAKKEGLHDGECLSSFGAKLCYKSLVLGQNANVTKVRDIPDNIKACISAGHSSVFGHVVLNFVTTNCSRLFTHELIRHEVGTEIEVPPGLHEWSQTSGRYVRLEKVDVAFDPVLQGCEDLVANLLEEVEQTIYFMECRLGLRIPNPSYPGARPGDFLSAQNKAMDNWQLLKWTPNDKMPFDQKKKLTSAIRRFAVNGQVNEIMWSANIRALRHMIQMRTSRFAEWEIRTVFGQVWELVREKFPVVFSDGVVEIHDGLPEVTGLRTQPYQKA